MKRSIPGLPAGPRPGQQVTRLPSLLPGDVIRVRGWKYDATVKSLVCAVTAAQPVAVWRVTLEDGRAVLLDDVERFVRRAGP